MEPRDHGPEPADPSELSITPLTGSHLSPLPSSSSGQGSPCFGPGTNTKIEGTLINSSNNTTINNYFSDPNTDRGVGDQESLNVPGSPPRDATHSQGSSLSGGSSDTKQTPSQRSNQIYESHLKHKHSGYPLWIPQPDVSLPPGYRTQGICIGDVGLFTYDGGFDFLFNICLPRDDPVNASSSGLPDEFVHIHPTLGAKDVRKKREFTSGSVLATHSVAKVYHDSFESPAPRLSFESSDPEGAILTIPDGADREELANVGRFRRYMKQHLENWYQFVNGPLGREAENGDIHLVVGCDKTTTWGMAVFSNPARTKTQLTFRLDKQRQSSSGSKHIWEYSAITGEARVGPDDSENKELGATSEQPLQNQCLFVRTLNVMLADPVWARVEASLTAREEKTSDSDYNTGSDYRSPSHAGVRGSSSTSFNDTQDSQRRNQPADELPAVGEYGSWGCTHHSFRMADFAPPPPTIHPSKILNKFLLSQKPDAIMAITHDQDWYSLLSDQDTVFPDSSVVVQRIQTLHDICEDDGIVYLQPKRRDQESIDEEKAQIAKLRLDLVAGRTSLLTYLFGGLHEEMESQLLRTIEDLDNCISSKPHFPACQAPLFLPGHPDRVLLLDDLLRLLQEAFVYEDMQEEFIPSLWNKLDLPITEDPSAARVQCLLRLGNALQKRYSRLNLVDDLENAVHCYSQAVALSQPFKSLYQHLDANLGLASSIHQRYIAKGHVEDLVILKHTLEQQTEFDVKMMLQPLEDLLSHLKDGPPAHPPANGMQAFVYSRGSQVPPVVFEALRGHPVQANVILPTLEKCCALDHGGQSPANHWWIVLYLPRAQTSVGFVLSVTDTHMGTGYPVFLFSTMQSAQLHANPAAVVPALQLLVDTLAANVPVPRVYSVFAHAVLATQFSRLWANRVGVSLMDAPYYDAWLTCLPRGIQLYPEADPRFELRPAVQGDIQDIARLCWMYADDFPPFTLSMQAAIHEAATLTQYRMVWVLRVNGTLASIVAFTRNSTQVATITKVYTDPSMRGHQYAGRLVRRVCYELMRGPGRETVALYVGRAKLSLNTFHRVGFQMPGSDSVEQWVEYGFGPDGVDLGHW